MQDPRPGTNPGPVTNQSVAAAIAFFNAGNLSAAYQKALPSAEQGDHEAQLLVGNVLSTDALGHADIPAARVWWERAASAGHSRAQYNLGVSYTDPDASGNNPALARWWLSEAAKGGHVDAMQRLGEWELNEAGDELVRAAEGYVWLRVACETGGMSARGRLGRALQASGWDDPARFEALQAEALRCTAPYRGAIGADLLRQADRGYAQSYFITGALCSMAGRQNWSQNAFALNPTKPNFATLPVVARKANRLIAESHSSLTGTAYWTICRRGISYPNVEVLTLPASRLWDVVRPGDGIEISDGVNSHLTTAFSVDRDRGVIRFMDAWPDEFLLLRGLNALGVDARVEPYGRTRKLLCITRDDFLLSVRGLVGLGGVASVEALWNGIPELHEDGNSAVAMASMLAGMPDAESCARGLGWLIALLRGEGPTLPADRVRAAADRAWLAAEQLLSEEPNRQIQCGLLGAIGLSEMPDALLEELSRRWPPTFDTITPQLLADVVSRRADTRSTATPSAAGTERRALQMRDAADPVLRLDDVGAEALLQHALQNFPGNELLRLLRARLQIQSGTDIETAARELDEVIDILDAKRQDPGPLVRDFDGVEVGIALEREEFGRLETSALALKSEALMALQRPREAVAALQNALTMWGSDEPALLAHLARAAEAAGDTAMVIEAEKRLEEARANLWARRTLNRL